MLNSNGVKSIFKELNFIMKNNQNNNDFISTVEQPIDNQSNNYSRNICSSCGNKTNNNEQSSYRSKIELDIILIHKNAKMNFILFIATFALIFEKIKNELCSKWGKYFDFVACGECYIEICMKNVNKAFAIQYLLDNYLKLNIEKLICFGDFDNDIEMFQLIKKSVTRLTTSENIKKHAK